MDLTGCYVMEDPMVVAEPSYIQLLQVGARRLTGHQRRLFQAEACLKLCDGNARKAERRFGWGRENVTKGLREYKLGFRCVEHFGSRGRRRAEAIYEKARPFYSIKMSKRHWQSLRSRPKRSISGNLEPVVSRKCLVDPHLILQSQMMSRSNSFWD